MFAAGEIGFDTEPVIVRTVIDQDIRVCKRNYFLFGRGIRIEVEGYRTGEYGERIGSYSKIHPNYSQIRAPLWKNAHVFVKKLDSAEEIKNNTFNHNSGSGFGLEGEGFPDRNED